MDPLQSVAVGPRIRSLREARALTVGAFAKDVGVSSGLISQVERGLTDPSLETLRRVAQALDVPIFSLFQDDELETAVRVVRSDRRMCVSSPAGALAYSRVSAGPGKLEMLEGVLEPSGASSEQLWSHPSEECTLVLDGELVVEVGEQHWVLAQGDSCSFNSRLPHRYRNTAEVPCRFVIAVTPPSF